MDANEFGKAISVPLGELRAIAEDLDEMGAECDERRIGQQEILNKAARAYDVASEIECMVRKLLEGNDLR